MASDWKFSVDVESPIAVYVQIENHIRFAVASGRIKKGETLPSVREMSSMLSVNPNTVTKAYRDLELMGLVSTRRGVGVTTTGEALNLTREKTRQMVRGHLRDAVAECVATGIPPREIQKVLEDTVSTGHLPYAGNMERGSKNRKKRVRN